MIIVFVIFKVVLACFKSYFINCWKL